jgi:hypothetical protein
MQERIADTLLAGHLKRDVSVRPDGERVRITYALWQVALSRDWIRANPVVEQLLGRHITRAEAQAYPAAQPLIALLGAQGCFDPVERPAYSLREVRALFDPLRSQWYAEYYAHPAWQRLREGLIGRSGLLAWLIHNYHVSRAAGVVAARMAARGGDNAWARFFRQDALDEYWHCDAYYGLDTPLLQDVGPTRIRHYVPLPSSRAFEEHTLQVAEHHPLGHILIAYFQEASIAFLDDSGDFYREVERQYDVQGLFNPWLQHIRIDVEQGHAEGLGHLLDDEAEVDAETLEQALQQAWLAFYFLRAALDDILAQDAGDTLAQRQPKTVPAGIGDEYELLHAWVAEAEPPGRLPDDERAWVRQGLRDSAFRALGFARRHDEIIACGHWAQRLSGPGPEASSAPGPWCVALTNFLHEAANTPTDWLRVARLLAEREPSVALPGEWGAAIDVLLCDRPVSRDSASALFVLDELLARCVTRRDRAPARLLRS